MVPMNPALLLKSVAAPDTEAPALDAQTGAPAAPSYPPLDQEGRPCISTDQAAYYLSRRPQTLRWWACYDNLPPGLDVKRINGRLAWSTAGIRNVLGVSR